MNLELRQCFFIVQTETTFLLKLVAGVDKQRDFILSFVVEYQPRRRYLSYYLRE